MTAVFTVAAWGVLDPALAPSLPERGCNSLGDDGK